MSYAGLYGPSETCEHDNYGRNCLTCEERRFLVRYQREWPDRKRHAEDARQIEPTTETVTLYSGACPNRLCSWRRVGVTRDVWQRDLDKHVYDCRQTAVEWSNAARGGAS